MASNLHAKRVGQLCDLSTDSTIADNPQNFSIQLMNWLKPETEILALVPLSVPYRTIVIERAVDKAQQCGKDMLGDAMGSVNRNVANRHALFFCLFKIQVSFSLYRKMDYTVISATTMMKKLW